MEREKCWSWKRSCLHHWRLPSIFTGADACVEKKQYKRESAFIAARQGAGVECSGGLSRASHRLTAAAAAASNAGESWTWRDSMA